ncbi:MAG: hypothetical protein WCW31_04475 [Patescibacteria group bacterium]|jgi:hypothetical protein
MKAANIVLVNFHHEGKIIAEALELDEVKRTPEEMQKKEEERAKNQNPGLSRNKADNGVPALGRAGESNVRIMKMVQDLIDSGFRLIGAYKQATFKTRWEDGVPHVTDQKTGTIARFVFSKDPASVAALSPEMAEKTLTALLKGLDGFMCPCAHVYHNFAEDKIARTTDTINIAKLSKEDERNEVQAGELRYTAGVFTVQRSRMDRYHQPNERY